jgi:hypothetical protein
MLFIAWLYRQLFHCCRRIENILFSPEKGESPSVPVTSLPWVWIGVKKEDGVVIDYTNEVNDVVEYGVIVTSDWLNEILNTENVTWQYLDSKTLEMTKFPSSGFVIDDSSESDAEDSDDK